MSVLLQNSHIHSNNKSFRNKPEWNALILTLSFFTLFTPFNTIQAYATSYQPKIGSISFGIVYLMMVMNSFFAPMIIHKIGYKWSFFTTFVCYSLYNLSYYIGNDVYLLITSILCGASAPILWSSQGSYLTKCCNVFEYQRSISYNSQIGWFKSLFFSIFSFHTTCGYLFAAIFFQISDSNSLFFICCTIISFISCGMILCLRNMPQLKYVSNINSKQNYGAIDNKTSNAASDDNLSPHNVNIGTLLLDTNKTEFHCLIGITMFVGMCTAFAFGEFPSLIEDKTIKFYSMSFYGFFGMIFAYFSGRLSDKIGNIIIITFAYLVMVVFFVMLLFEINNEHHSYYTWIVLASLMGIGGLILFQQVSILYAKLLGNEPHVFAKYTFLVGIATSISFFYHYYLSMRIKIFIALALCIISYLALFVHPKNRIFLQMPQKQQL